MARKYARIVRKTISQTDGWFGVIDHMGKVRGVHTGEGIRRVTVGIDPSMTGTGVAVFTDGELVKYWAWTEIKSLQKRNRGTLIYFKKPQGITPSTQLGRIRMIAGWIGERLTELTMHGDEVTVALEGLALNARGRGVSDLYELSGQIKQTLLTLDIPFRIYDPLSVKLAATGNGSADKGDMKIACYRKLGLDVTPYGKAGENIADACLLAWLLEQELAIKAGALGIKKLPADTRKVLLRTTKAAQIALISLDLISNESINLVEPVV